MTRYNNQQRSIAVLSLALSLLIMGSGIIAIDSKDFYQLETINWQVQAQFQDYFDLWVVVPLLIISALLFFRGNRTAMWLWGGTILYLSYTYAIYCFGLHFNALFIFYCLILGLSFYSFVAFLSWQFLESAFNEMQESYASRISAFYFIIVSLAFAFLWISEDVTAIRSDQIPASVQSAGLPTNPVHVLDIAILLPGFFLVGVFLLARKPAGLILAPILLVFSILMNTTIAGIILMMSYRGLDSNNTIALVMAVLTLLSITLLAGMAKRT